MIEECRNAAHFFIWTLPYKVYCNINGHFWLPLLMEIYISVILNITRTTQIFAAVY